LHLSIAQFWSENLSRIEVILELFFIELDLCFSQALAAQILGDYEANTFSASDQNIRLDVVFHVLVVLVVPVRK